MSGMAMRSKQCMFKNIDVSKAKETFVVKYYILKFPVHHKRQKVQHDKSFSRSNLSKMLGNYWETSTGFKIAGLSGDISSSGSTLSPDESENEEEGDPPPSQASTVKGVAVFSWHQNFAR